MSSSAVPAAAATSPGLLSRLLPTKSTAQISRLCPIEPTACPTMTRGPFAYDLGDTACMTPLLAMYTLGHAFVPPPIHAGGLRYHGMAPLVCQAIVEGLARAKGVSADQVLRGGDDLGKNRRLYLRPGNQPRNRRHHRRGESRPGKKARKRSSCSTTAATALWTSPATTPLCRENSPITSCPRKTSRNSLLP